MLPAGDLNLIQDWCAHQVPEHARDRVQVDCTVRGRTVTIVERQPVWSDSDGEWFEVPAARMKYDETAQGWTLSWFDRNSKAHRYTQLPPHQAVAKVIREIERDPTCIFWG